VACVAGGTNYTRGFLAVSAGAPEVLLKYVDGALGMVQL